MDKAAVLLGILPFPQVLQIDRDKIGAHIQNVDPLLCRIIAGEIEVVNAFECHIPVHHADFDPTNGPDQRNDLRQRVLNTPIHELVHIQRDNYLLDLLHLSQRILQVLDRGDARKAQKQGVIIQKARHIPFQTSLCQVGGRGARIPGNMNPRGASDSVGAAPAGEPAVLPLRVFLIVQTDLKALDIPIHCAVGHQEAAVSGDVPKAVLIHIEARDSFQVMKIRQHAGQQSPGGRAAWEAAVHILTDTLL